MAEIVRRAGGSLSTLYAQFGGKKGLFEAMIDARVGQLTTQMEIELAAHAPLREGLTRIGEDFLIKQVQPENLDFFRLMVSPGQEIPRHRRSAGASAHRKPCARRWPVIWKTARVRARSSSPITNIAASIYFDLAPLPHPVPRPADAVLRADRAEIREHVDRAVKVFIGGIEALN